MAKLYFRYGAMNSGKTTIFPLDNTSGKPLKFNSFFEGQKVLKTERSETKIFVIREISDLRIDNVLESNAKNSFSKKLREVFKS